LLEAKSLHGLAHLRQDALGTAPIPLWTEFA
jgi:hypothetical protein